MSTALSTASTPTNLPSPAGLIAFLAAEDGQPVGVRCRDPLAERLAAEDGLAVGVSPGLRPSDPETTTEHREQTAIESPSDAERTR